MKAAIEYFVAIVILTIGIFLLAGFGAASIDAANARDMHASIIAELEAGNFSDPVIAKCRETVSKSNEEKGTRYTLLIEGPIALANHEKMAQVSLTYDYSVGLLNLTGNNHVIRGIAR